MIGAKIIKDRTCDSCGSDENVITVSFRRQNMPRIEVCLCRNCCGEFTSFMAAMSEQHKRKNVAALAEVI
jgi:hypothetical protein